MTSHPAPAGARLRVVALASYPRLAACTRFRISEYARPLAERGIDVELHSVLTDEQFARFYTERSRAKKALQILEGSARQLVALLRDRADVVWVQREATFVGPALLEWLAARLRRIPLVYDLDDAVWVSTAELSRHPLAARLLKAPGKTWTLLDMAEHVVAGSRYLARVSAERNPHVTVLPTVVSRDVWVPLPGRLAGDFVDAARAPVIGFIGTHTSAKALSVVAPALRRLRASGRRFEVLVVGADPDFTLPGVECTVRPFRLESEITDFQRVDIGIAPVLPIEFAKGKCAFKQIEYMAVGVPCVSTPEGGALDFIQHGVNGLLASSDDEWVSALSSLLDDRDLRARIATAGRDLVERRLSIEAQADTLSDILWAAGRRARPVSQRSETDGVNAERGHDHLADSTEA